MADFPTLYTASGSTADFAVPFPYLSKGHLVVKRDGVTLVFGTEWTLPSASVVRLTAGNPVAGTIVSVDRQTPYAPMAVFTSGPLKSEDLNVVAKQALYAAEEAEGHAQALNVDYSAHKDKAWTVPSGVGGTMTKGALDTVPKFTAAGNLIEGPSVADVEDAAENAAIAVAARDATLAAVPSLYPTSLANLFAANPTIHTHQYLSAPGLEGYWHRVDYAAYSAWIAADTQNGIVGQSTHPLGVGVYGWLRDDLNTMHVDKFGAKGDGTIDVNRTIGRQAFANIAAVQAATITGDPDVIMVKGTPYVRVDDNHEKFGYNRNRVADYTTGTGWSITLGVATGVAGTGSNLTLANCLPHAGTPIILEADVAQTSGQLTPIAGTGGVGATAVAGVFTGRIKQLITCGSGRGLFLNKSAAWAGTVDLNTVSIRAIYGAIKSANGRIYAPTDPKYMPFGTGDVTGTDDRLAFVGAMAMGDLLRRPVEVGPKHYRVDIGQTYRTVILPAGNYFHMVGSPGASKIIANDDKDWMGPTIGAFPQFPQTGNVFIGNPSFYETAFSSATPENYDANKTELFMIRGVDLQSTWWRDMQRRQRAWLNPTPVGAAGPYRCQMLAPCNNVLVHLEDMLIEDVLGTAVYGCSNGTANYINVHCRRMNGNGLRSENTRHTTADRVSVLHCDDDSVSFTDQDDRPNSQGPRARTCRLTNFTIEFSEGMLMMGSFDLTVANGTMFGTYGTGLGIFNMPVEGPGQGSGGTTLIDVSGVKILNQMDSNDRPIVPDGTWEPTRSAGVLLRGAVGTAVTTAAALGEGTTTPLLDKWYGGDYGHGGLHHQDIVGDGTGTTEFPATGIVGDPVASGYRGYSLRWTNNAVVRTLPSVPAYNEWGYGWRNTRFGRDNPPVTDDNFAMDGIEVRGAWDSVYLEVGHIGGFPKGAGIEMSAEGNLDWSFKNFIIGPGIIEDCRHGITHNVATASNKTHDITIFGVKFNLDPLRKQPERGVNGRWLNGDVGGPTGVYMPYIGGLKIIGCHFSNLVIPYVIGGATAVGSQPRNTLLSNVVSADPSTSLGTAEYHADNRGVARIFPAMTGSLYYEYMDLSVGSEVVRSGGLVNGEALPSSGYYVRGHEFTVMPTGEEYVRGTTGAAHVVGTDWLRKGSATFERKTTYETIATDASATLVVGTNGAVIQHTGTLTANRSLSLSTAGATVDRAFRITRTGSGAFNLSIGGLKNLVTNTWCVVRWDGAAWYLSEYGAL